MNNTAASAETPGRTGETGLRVDAERNRERILAAARRLYAREGLGVSMGAIAREAGVGKATLSRRFADPDELISAVFADRMDAYAAAATASLDDPDPWHGFTSFVWAVCAMQAADRGFAHVLITTFPASEVLEGCRTEAYESFIEIIARAKATGHLREDFTSQDLIILLMANAGVITAAGDAAPDAWRRLVAHTLRSYAAPGAPLPPLPEAPAPAALARAMANLNRADSA